jgi:hypothetical protein
LAEAVRAEIYEPDESLPADLVALRKFARVMDNAVMIPGTNRGVGLDAVIGLIPGFGDAAGALFSLWILVGALRHRVPFPVFAKMVWNILVDLVVGAIPVVGDIFDFLFTENMANVEMVIRNRNRVRPPRGLKEAATAFLFIGAALLVIVVGIVIATVVFAVIALRSRG